MSARPKHPWRDFLTEEERAYLDRADAARPKAILARRDWRRAFPDRPRIIQRGFGRARRALKLGAGAEDHAP